MVIRMKIPVNINITTERLTENGPYGVDGAETERIESSASGIMKKTGNMLQLQYIEASAVPGRPFRSAAIWLRLTAPAS